MTDTREEILEKCKAEARPYLDRGDLMGAVITVSTALREHEEFKGIVDKLMPLAMLHIANNDLAGVRRYVEGFR
jgi:hypothetical protein